jgi:transcription antitermination factor NusG
MDGEVKDIMEQASKVKVEVTIIGRSLAVELEYWQVEEF